MDKIIAWFKAWWSRHICAEFPYEDKCWDCNLTDCTSCDVIQ